MSKIFEKRSIMPTTMQRVMAFHEHPRAINRLTPPPIFVQCLRDNRQSLTEGELDFRLWFGPIPVRWIARHEPGPTATSFQDRMIEGPLSSWLHQHMFSEVPDGVELIDRVTFEHKPGFSGLMTRLLFGGLPLHILFLYRHWRTRRGTKL